MFSLGHIQTPATAVSHVKLLLGAKSLADSTELRFKKKSLTEKHN